MGSLSFLSEAELHCLVDGRIEADRRADVLRRLSASPADRALVEAWQEQSDLIRAAFHEVEREPLPASLDLAPQPRLLCVTGGAALTDAPPKPAGSRGAVVAGFATLVLVTIGLGASWLLVDSTGRDREVAGVPLRGTIDATLADRASAALRPEAVRRARRAPTALASALPTTRIPDLGPAGFSLTDAETEAHEPASLVFRYQNAGAERIAISVARAPQDAAGAAAAPARIGNAYSWHRQENAFAIAGTLAPERLRAIAVALQDDDGDP